MDYDVRMAHIKAKVYRSNKLLRELDEELLKWLESEPYKIAASKDESRNRYVYVLTEVKSVPLEVTLITGDIIQNLTTALDHLAYQLVCKNTNDSPPRPNKIMFPIGNSKEGYDLFKMRALQGASSDVINAIDDIEPYNGGNNLLWQLKSLNNLEKHRLLLTAAHNNLGVSIDAIAPLEMLENSDHGRALLNDDWRMNIYVAPEKPFNEVGPGYILHEGIEGEPKRENIRFKLDIGLNEPGIVVESELFKPLLEFNKEVTDVVETLAVYLKD